MPDEDLDSSLGIERLIDQAEADLWSELKENKSFLDKFLRNWKKTVTTSTRTANTKLAEVKRIQAELTKLVPKKISAITDPVNNAKAKDSWEKQDFDLIIWVDNATDALVSIDENNTRIKEAGNITARVKAKETYITGYVKDIDERIDIFDKELPADLNVTQCEAMRHNCKQLQDEVDKLKDLYDEKIDINPDHHLTYTEQYFTDRGKLTKKITTLLSKVSKQLTSTPNTSLVDSSQLQNQLREAFNQTTSTTKSSKSKSLYKKRDYPTFDGDILKYPRWRNEMKKSALSDLSDDEVIILLDDITPDTIRLEYCKSLEEAWEKLDNRYKNPAAVTSKLIKQFLNFQVKTSWDADTTVVMLEDLVTTTYMTLSWVDREKQLTEVEHVMIHAMSLLPATYRDQVIALQIQNKKKDDMDRKSDWTIYYDFLVEKKLGLEMFGTKAIDDIIAEANGKASGGKREYCGKCRKHHKPDTECPPPKPRDPHVSHTLTGIQKMWETFGPCPTCKKNHHFFAKPNNRKLASARLYDCPQWRGKTQLERAKILEKAGGCALCTGWDHKKDDCKAKTKHCTHKDNNGQECKGAHNKSFHGLNYAYVNLAERVETSHLCSNTNPVMLPMQHVDLNKHVSTTVFGDTGSNTTLITYDLAKQLRLKGHPATTSIRFASKDPEVMETTLYQFNIYSNDGVRHKIVAIGVKQITSKPEPVNIEVAYRLFPQAPPGSLERPVQEVGLLLGYDQARLLPYGGDVSRGERVDGLTLLRSPLGTGFLLAGQHNDIPGSLVTMSTDVNMFRSATNITNVAKDSLKVNHIMRNIIPDLVAEYEDDLGTKPPSVCYKCKGCKQCQSMNTEMSHTDQEVLKLVRAGMTLDTETNRIHAKYPMNDNYKLLGDNRHQAIKREESVERSITRLGRAEEYNSNYRDSIDRGALVRVTEDEIAKWKAGGGLVHYIGHHPVYKDTSKSTPLRIVSDSAMRNLYTGPSLNDCSAKGPKSLNSLLDILLRWRADEAVIILDLKKAYNSILTGPTEKMLRLQVWRWCDSDKDWETYGYQCVAFGDVVAALCLENAKVMCAERGRELNMDPQACDLILFSFYVDDGIISVRRADIPRLVGQVTVNSDGKLTYDGTLCQILALGGFRPKAIIKTGHNIPAELEQLSPILGHTWSPDTDDISFTFTIRCKTTTAKEELVTPDNVTTTVLSRRTCLAISAQFYDPMGLCSPYTFKFRAAMREVVSLNITWDTTIPEDMATSWRKLITDTITAPPITFPRPFIGQYHDSIEPAFEVIGYWDGSDVGYCGALYCRWLSHPGATWSTHLICAKSRVTPVSGLSTPRAEVNGLLLLTRMLVVVCKALPVKPRRITLIGDSECTIASMEAVNVVLAAYFRNRVSECWDNLKMCGTVTDTVSALEELPPGHTGTLIDRLQHTPGPSNISDLGTRGNCTTADIGPGTEWQTGPAYLTTHRSHWPLSRDFIREIPEEEKRNKAYKLISTISVTADTGLLSILSRVGKWDTARGAYARVIRAHLRNDDQSIFLPLTAEDYVKADHLLYLFSMPETRALEIDGKLSSLSVFWESGVCYTRGRLGSLGAEAMLGTDKLVVLSAKCRLAHLIMVHSHSEDHRRDPGDALYRSRKHAWIVNGRHLAKKVCRECAWCKHMNRTLCQQKMSDLPAQIFQIPTAPFTNITLDFMAPMMVKSMTNKRAKMKVYPLILACMNTGSIQMMIATGYSTDDFLLQFESFCALRGQPSWIYSDPGSQLRAAQKHTTDTLPNDLLKNLDWTEIASRTAHKGTVWKICPSQSQWRDGRSERLIALVKQSFARLHGGQELNYAELQCLMNKASNCVNQRPLGVQHHDGHEPGLAPVTPNTLLQGFRTKDLVEDESRFDDTPDKYVVRLKMMEKMFHDWWQMFYREAFFHMLPFRKWKKEFPNLLKNDICLLQFKGKLAPADYRMCRVTETYEDANGLVRTVQVALRPRDKREPLLPYSHKDLITMTVPVQRLVLLVPVSEQVKTGLLPGHTESPTEPESPTVESPTEAVAPATDENDEVEIIEIPDDAETESNGIRVTGVELSDETLETNVNTVTGDTVPGLVPEPGHTVECDTASHVAGSAKLYQAEQRAMCHAIDWQGGASARAKSREFVRKVDPVIAAQTQVFWPTVNAVMLGYSVYKLGGVAT